MREDLTPLGCVPSAVEVLQGDFPDWDIWRERSPGGRHGDWCARPVGDQESEPLRHANVEGLRDLLMAADLQGS
ncbi:hypothetical protein [Nonomuraea sp. C10]|uniref:hypothetical protein n=1 Tax=Nonomuraea sp. C10 TaxID=2600577 RepID=UPI0011CDE32C|nr:hypothetical protein [Nonomuraea sp. C10]TXK41480.1 hypothetical protein FR742_19600 [Nonomuraea sp. C10]